LEAATQYALLCVSATSDLYRLVSMWCAGHEWGKASRVVHAFLVARRLLFHEKSRDQITLCRREFTQARQARGPIQDWTGSPHLNAHEAAVNILLTLYSFIQGVAHLIGEEIESRLDEAARGIKPILRPFPPKEVPWLHQQFERRRDAIRASVLQSFRNLDTRSLAIEVEWEAIRANEARPVAQHRTEQTSPVARAIALMLDRQKQTGKLMKIRELKALMPGVSIATLYRDAQFKATRRAIKDSLRANIPHGHKDAEGSIDAYDEDA
jgi:hypothetical protein